MRKNVPVIAASLGLVVLAACASSPKTQAPPAIAEQHDIRHLILQPLPGWAKDSLEEGYFLDIDQLMKEEKLSRFEAVEVQSQMREKLSADEKSSIVEAFELALARVRQGMYDSLWKPVKFDNPGDFVLAVDGDETIFKQWYGSGEKGFFDEAGITPDQAVAGNGERVLSSPYVKFTPGVEKFILRMRRNPHCKGVVLFSGKRNVPTLEIVSKWKFSNGDPASKYLDGVFGRSHMILGKRILVPSKDLRILDPELKHVVLVDDNPTKVVQQQLVLAQPKFDADRYFRARETHDEVGISYYESLLANTAWELEETAEAATLAQIPFAQAFLPYSYSGERVFRTLESTLHSYTKALALTRMRPELQDATFRPDRDLPAKQ